MILIPYCKVDGVRNFTDSFIESLFTQMSNDGLVLRCFPCGDMNNYKFVRMFKTNSTLLYIITMERDIIGFAWLNNFNYTSGHIHFCVFKKFWGHPDLVETFNEGLQELLTQKDDNGYIFNVLLGMIDSKNKIAINFARKLKSEEKCTLPGMAERHDRLIDYTVFTFTR